MWTKFDIPQGEDASISGTCSCPSRLIHHVHVVSIQSPGEGKLTVLTYAYADSGLMGVKNEESGQREWLCTSELISKQLCSNISLLFITPVLDDQGVPGKNPYAYIHQETFDFDADETKTSFQSTYIVARHGLFCVRMAYEKTPDMTMMPIHRPEEFESLFRPQWTFKNPYGHLPATHYFYLQFYGALALIYFVLTVAWTALAWRKRTLREKQVRCP